MKPSCTAAGIIWVLPLPLAPHAVSQLEGPLPDRDHPHALHQPATEPAARTPDPALDSPPYEGPLLPSSMLPPENRYLALGVALEAFGRSRENGDTFAGLAAMYRLGSFGPHASLLVRPSEGIESWRFLTGLGVRSYLPVGPLEISYGVGVYLEARLLDHYWLAHAMPLELGTVLTRAGSWNIELFLGARYAFAGELINSFLIDPNGFDNEDAQDHLKLAREERPWRGFVRIVFGRRID